MEAFKSKLARKFETILIHQNRYRKDNPIRVSLSSELIGAEQEQKLLLCFQGMRNKQIISIPVPYLDEKGNYVIGKRVRRAVGSWMHDGSEYTYWNLLSLIFTGRIEKVFANMGKKSWLETLVNSFDSSYTSLVFRKLQLFIDDIVNRLPLTGTDYQTWAMCHRVVFLDPSFEELGPDEALEYQKDLNKKYFPWTSLGLSDSAMTENYLLKKDLRMYTPFGIKHHNPMRNLYQTLGMEGDETPVVLTKSAAKLADRGIERRGWNFLTCYLDLPLNFEDQLILDTRHLDKVTTERKRILVFGEPFVFAGEQLEYGQQVAVEPGGKIIRWWSRCDNAIVESVEKEKIVFNGKEEEIAVVYVKTKHLFKEGIKLTNCHGNKGVATFADCGTMYDTAKKMHPHPIDIIVSAKTVGKRKNYGQLLEAFVTLLAGTEKEIILDDEAEIDVTKLRQALVEKGYHEDGTSPVKTGWGEFRAVCGWVFWGLIKNPESQLWDKSDLEALDNRGRRIGGVKVSHIEFKSLTTIFGPNNAVNREILSYQQGISDVYEMLKVIGLMDGRAVKAHKRDWSSIRPLTQGQGYFHRKEELEGTIIDPQLCPDGFALKLPALYHIFIPNHAEEEIKEQILPLGADLEKESLADGKNVFLDSVYVPSINLRNSWEHATGLWGLSDIGGYLNSLVAACHTYQDSERDQLYRSVRRYLHYVAKRMGTKNGEISNYALSVRYPHSTKATATLAKEGLPKNTVEIHRDMAKNLNVTDGDLVIVERFPCLGFKSLRIQRVKVTDDRNCRYVVRVSGNSLVSQNLDFDGDVLFLMSFQTQEAKDLIAKEFENPNKLRLSYIEEANEAKVPRTQEMNLDDYNIEVFPELTPEKQAEIVSSLTGVKRGTGTAVSLAYNLMRIIEGSVGFEDKKTNLALEVILDKVANSVFSQKHAGESLEKRCKRAVCLADYEDMIKMGFPKEGSASLCSIIRTKAQEAGVTNLKKHFDDHLKKGTSNVINLIVREKHKVYFATRSNLHPIKLLSNLDSEPTDLVSQLWHATMYSDRRLTHEQPKNQQAN